MIDSSNVSDAKQGIDLVVAVYYAVTALIAFFGGRIHALRKKR